MPLVRMRNLLASIDPDLSKKIGAVLQLTLLVLLVWYLLGRLSDLGWRDVLANLPTNPLFYAIFLFNFLLFPTSELLIYRRHWRPHAPSDKALFFAFLRKQALNDAVLSYSGEAFLFLWGRRNLTLGAHKIFAIVKDSTLLSAAVSSSATFFIVLIFWYTGGLETLLNGIPTSLPYIAAALTVGILVVPILLVFGKRILQHSRKELRRIAGMHFLRMMLFESLLIAQWSLILPEVPLLTWVGFIAAKLVLTRIPFMPNKELILLGLAVTLVAYIPTPEAALAGLFLANTALSQISNLLVIIVFGLLGLRKTPGAALPDEAPVTPPETTEQAHPAQQEANKS
ncbi:hypothetical protein GCM10017044_00610 [Kordiimonas sediminis]|uniref:Uncharacterized protein n=1 Tax=Kordiimonas sediminis TaxID=1735581 RepID=A0A919AJM9_9PROT|nr:hypothetical protein [Kordiimonas sediminis]GHF10806.1 hypothetical protein GCM10017044_00610 [Kordiimonas sediminis]